MKESRIESFNQAVRAIVTLSLTAGFIWLAWTGEIDSGVFANTYGIIVTFWFVQRQAEKVAADAKAAAEDTKAAIVAATTPPPVAEPPKEKP